MKYGKILTFFSVSLLASIVIRFLQLLFMVEHKTGFFFPQFIKLGYGLMAFVALLCVALFLVCFKCERKPTKLPKTNFAPPSFSVALSVALAADLLITSSYVLGLQRIVLILTGILATVYFLCFGIFGFLGKNLNNIFTVAPAIYFIARVVYYFSAVSSISFVSDNILLLSTYCLVLLFMLNFAKLYNNIDEKHNHNKIMAYGFISSLLCFTQSVPDIVVQIVSDNSYNRTPLAENIVVFLIGLFIITFTLSYFSYENIKKSQRVID